MDWDDLRIVLAVSRAGNLTGAAKELGVNHSTVSRRLHGFEDRLGVRLFERLPTGYEATEAGRELLVAAERMENEANAVANRILGQDGRLFGSVRVTAPNLMFSHVLMPDLVRFSREYPGIELRLVASYENLSLTRREADVAIRATQKPQENLIGRKVARLGLAFYLRRDLLEQTGGARGGAVPLLGVDDADEPLAPEVLRAYPKPRLAAAFNDASMTLEAVRQGLGAGLIACYSGEADPDLVRLPDVPVFRRDLWLLTHRDLRGTARVRTLLDFLAEVFDRRRRDLEGPDEEGVPL
ncbi:MAG TPA: LysR family transcriptional regulator [Polyangiaceae bacterium LLY-WYZ-14_1]|nr:LysR family transcriptional regulator [Polyangiaceae bacterium LLY-WYZ-14_1]